MRRHERKRVEADLRRDVLRQTERGRQQYWQTLRTSTAQASLFSLLESTLSLDGEVIECGVYRGRSALRIARILRESAPHKTFFACDSFEGFPEEQVGRVDVGWLRFLSRIRRKFRSCADTPSRLNDVFQTYDVRAQIVKGYFSETLPQFSNKKFCFIHLDCDIYSSYKECLESLYDNLVPGGVVVFDDYKSPKWPGAEKAVNEFFTARNEEPTLCQERVSPAWYVRKSTNDQTRAA